MKYKEIKLRDKKSNYNYGYFKCNQPCEICGNKEAEMYHRSFEKCGWFRGDDEMVGNVCEYCWNKMFNKIKNSSQ